MNFFAATLAYPTVWWTVASGFVILYWLIVAGGGWDVDAMASAETRAADRATDLGPLAKLGLGSVPLGVSSTVVVLLNFWGCYAGLKVIGPVALGKGMLLMGGVFSVSLPLAVLLSWSLRPLFRNVPTAVQPRPVSADPSQ